MRYLLTIASFVVFAVGNFASAGEYLADNGELAHDFSYERLSTGGFVGRFSTTITVAKDGEWKFSRQIGGRKPMEFTGKLDEPGLAALAEVLESRKILELPEVIGLKKPTPSPMNVADGASTTFTIVFGEKKITAHAADGVNPGGLEAQKMLNHLAAMAGQLEQKTVHYRPK